MISVLLSLNEVSVILNQLVGIEGRQTFRMEE
jgi:hypothetical protein